MVGVGVLQHGGDHMAVQPSVKGKVEHGFLMPTRTLRKGPLSFTYEVKKSIISAISSVDGGHQCSLSSSLLSQQSQQAW